MESPKPKPRYETRAAYKFARQLRMELGEGRYFPAVVEYISQQYERAQLENGNRRILHEDDRTAVQAGILSCEPVTTMTQVSVPVQANDMDTGLKVAS